MKALFAIAVVSLGLPTASLAAAVNDAPSLIGSLPTFYQSKPAVDGVNGKVQVFGGASQGYTTGPLDLPLFVSTGIPAVSAKNVWYGTAGGAGAITIPIGHSFGVQFDGLSALSTNVYNGGGAGHFFWRDPDKGLVGAYGSGLFSAFSGGVGNWQAAGEAEAYLDRFTIGGIAGIQGFTNNNYNNLYDALLSPTIALAYGSGFYSSSNPNRFFDNVAVSYYPIDDFKISAGHIYSGGKNFATVGAEYLLPQFRGGNTAVSAYAEGIIGANNNNAAMAGIKIYFGNHDKTLIRRQREDDPEIKHVGIMNYWNLPHSYLPSVRGLKFHRPPLCSDPWSPICLAKVGGSYGGGIQTTTHRLRSSNPTAFVTSASSDPAN